MRRVLMIVGVVALAFLLVYAAGCKQKAQQPPPGQPPAAAPGTSPAESTGTMPDTTGGAAKGYGDPPPAAKGDVSFAKSVQPLFAKKCANASCHGAAKSAGMQLTSGMAYANIVNVASSEDPKLMRVKPGAPDESWLVMKLEGKQTFGARMPLSGGYLSDAQIQMIRQWIQAGAQNN